MAPLLLLFLLLLSLPPSSASPRFAPADHLLLNCGSSSPASLPVLPPFLPDRHRFSASSSSSASDPSAPAASPYSTARLFRRPSTYTLPLLHRGPHLLSLHFRPFLHLRAARFHVLAAGSVLLRDLSFPCMDAPSAPPVVREFFLHLDSDHLDLSFVPASPSDLAFVSAIQLLSVPSDLLPDAAISVESARLVITHGISKTNLETLYRVNVGGAKVTPFNDTLWRTWVPDAQFVAGDSSPSHGIKPVYFSGRIQYQDYGSSREIAPDHIYGTARVISSEGVAITELAKNMSWAFSVPPNHKYLIRLHFCDIASLALYELYFNVLVNGEMAYENFDMTKASNQMLAAPYYEDFVTGPDSSGQLAVTITPSNMSTEFRIHGLLNGIEIMKMSNLMGNLDGDLPALVVLGSWKEKGAIGFVPFVLVAVLFSVLLAAGFMLVSRWRNACSRSASGWSLLPLDAPEGKLGYEIPMTASKTLYL